MGSDTGRKYYDFDTDEVKGKTVHAKAHKHAQIAEQLLGGIGAGVFPAGFHANVPVAQVHATLANMYATLAAGELA